MDNQDLTQLNIEISASDATDEELDRMTRQLLSKLRELDVESVELAKGGPAPKGSKGDPITIGAIALQVMPAILPSVLGVVQDWVAHGRGARTIKFKYEGIEFEGSREDLEKILERLEKGKRKKK